MIKNIIYTIVAIFTFVLTFGNFVQAREIVEVPHWKKSTITVYIPKDDTAKAKTTLTKNAFSAWSGASYGRLGFKYVEKGPADINIVFKDGEKLPVCTHSIKTEDKIITGGELHIAKNTKPHSSEYVYKSIMHEIGSLLGLPASTKPTSIMYPQISTKQVIMKVDIRKLYSINGWAYNTH